LGLKIRVMDSAVGSAVLELALLSDSEKFDVVCFYLDRKP